MHRTLNHIAGQLPQRWQSSLKGLHYAHQIRAGKFSSPEPEFNCLERWIKQGDWVLDVGANVGHYTKRMSDLVGDSGRVLAIEPVPETFAYLASNCARFTHRNVTLMNVAVSNEHRLIGMEIPASRSSAKNLYQARVKPNGALSVYAMPLDTLQIPERICVVKIDVEGHEHLALKGMAKLIQRDLPILIVEGTSEAVESLLASHRYTWTQLPGSPNRIYEVTGQLPSARHDGRLGTAISGGSDH